jgi:hypothetical protein
MRPLASFALSGDVAYDTGRSGGPEMIIPVHPRTISVTVTMYRNAVSTGRTSRYPTE